jgi:hypothetical protein
MIFIFFQYGPVVVEAKPMQGMLMVASTIVMQRSWQFNQMKNESLLESLRRILKSELKVKEKAVRWEF